jgi:dynamin 1-like protein
MEQLIPIVNKLQDVFGAIGQSPIDLPQIVTIGSQSSGKSSVLESVVGRGFLPRGTGIVTRRPLILQLYNTSNSGNYNNLGSPGIDYGPEGGGNDDNNDDEDDEEVNPASSANSDINDENLSTPVNTRNSKKDDKDDKSKAKGRASLSSNAASPVILPGDEWGEFLHLPGEKFYQFQDICNEIVRETDRSTGRNKGISNKSINLKIYSPRVLNLTLVDLPGITKVSVGDQPLDIEDQIRDMCLNYISNPNAIILAVTAGNTDLANSDALKLARSVDPDGVRTIGVLTKLDLMDPGTDASEMLANRVIPLRRGYVGVINRGQRDITQKRSIREGLKKEMEFFKNHPSYRSLAHRCGTSTLSKMLNSILMHHIRDCLPEIKNRITGMMADIQQELDALGTPTGDISRATLGGSLLSLLSKFAAGFGNAVDGRGSSADGVEMNELYGGARISYIFNEIFGRSLMAIDPFDGLSDSDIRTAICNANGPRPSLFVPEISFDLLVRRQISRLEQPGLQCIDLVYDELQRMSSQCEPGELTRFPELRDRMCDTVSSLLRRCVAPTQMMISNLIKVELAYINTSHPDFIGGSRAVAQLMERMSQENSQEQQAAAMPPPPPNRREEEMNAADDDDDFSSSAQGGQGDGRGGLMGFIFGGKKEQARRDRMSMGGPMSPGNMVKLPSVPDTMRHTEMPTDRERIETEIIKSLIESYFNIVRKNFLDMVPKTIMYFLVNHSKDSIQNELVSELYKENEIADLLRETDDVAQRRKTCKEMRGLLARALEIVNEVRDFNTFK